MVAADTETLTVRGLRAPAEILVDKWGVPHMYAKSAEDLFFVQGFNAARDRLFQIDLWRRRGLGRVAEVMGPAYAEQDRAARLFLYNGSMEKEWAAYGPDTRKIVTAFVAGINSYVDWLGSHPGRVPVEFGLVGYGPARWEPEDVLRIRSHGLTRNLTSEVARARTLCGAGPGQWDQLRVGLQPSWEIRVPEGLDVCLPKDVLRVFTLATRATPFGGVPGTESEGSNNWTIAPKKSATGRPILAGDPHRAYTTPSLRYIAHLESPELRVIGAGEPALPGVSMGHNDEIAFGLTIFNIDQEDLYVYELNPSDLRQYRYKGGWESMRAVREKVAVKGEAQPREEELLFTRHGPVIYVDREKRRAYAVRSCWLEPGMSAYAGSLSYMRASNWKEFVAGRFRGGAPTVNQVYADVKGNIGWSPGGLTPVRKNWDGLLPVPGDGRYEWAGFWGPSAFPSSYNPASGWVSTSNEMNLPAGYPNAERKLGFEWTNDSRHTRIEEVLRSLGKVSLEDSMKLQFDLTSIPARRLIAMLSAGSDAPGVSMLRKWNAVESVDSAEAALFEVWWKRHLSPAFVRAVAPAAAVPFIANPDAAVMLDTLEGKSSRFRMTGRDALLLRTLSAAWDEMLRLGGPDPAKWAWGKLHTTAPKHPLRDFVTDPAVKAKLQPGPWPAPGGPYTPSQSMYTGNSFALTNGPSYRMVLDVGNWDASRAVNFPGQSGDPESPHYKDLAPLWGKGEYFPLLWTRAAVEAATEKRIVLQPER